MHVTNVRPVVQAMGGEAMAASETDWLGDVKPAKNIGGRPAKGHTGRQRKIHCERCQVILYGSRAALERSGLPFCGCGERMVLANFRDRVAAGDADALAVVDAEAGAEFERAAQREALAA